MSHTRKRLDYWTVYKITSPNGRVYIGCTNLDMEDRFNKGRGYQHNKEMFDDIVLYGWNSFKKQVLFEFENEQDARECEHEEIKKYPDGYNIYRGQKQRYNPNWKPERKRVMCVETEKIYDSIYQAAKENGLAKNKISYCCRGLRNKTGGYHWKFI